MKTKLFLSLVGAAFLVAACGPDDTQPATDHERAKQQWSELNVLTYSYEFQVTCYCPDDTTREVLIEVTNDEVTRVTYTDDGTDVTAVPMDWYPTIEGLFAEIDEAIANNADTIDVTYDDRYGYPTDIFIDHSAMMADEETDWTASNLELPLLM